MIEPLSLLSISKFTCEKLILVGDPMQLPPTLTTQQQTTRSQKEESGLGRTLFSRLLAAVLPLSDDNYSKGYKH